MRARLRSSARTASTIAGNWASARGSSDGPVRRRFPAGPRCGEGRDHPYATSAGTSQNRGCGGCGSRLRTWAVLSESQLATGALFALAAAPWLAVVPRLGDWGGWRWVLVMV